MPDYSLMKSQKNEVLELIRDTTLDPNGFTWSAADSSDLDDVAPGDIRLIPPVSKLSYDDSPYYFIFDLHRREHYSIYSPGEDKLHDEQFPGGWDNQVNYVKKWLGYLEREVRQPDLWDELVRQKIFYDGGPSPDTTNELFTEAQSAQIAEGIENIRTYLLSEFQGNSHATELINGKLDYLIDGSKRQGRKDWFHTCIGVYASVVTALAMSPEQAKNIWLLLKSAISGIIRLLPI